jgi:hypothetical protein
MNLRSWLTGVDTHMEDPVEDTTMSHLQKRNAFFLILSVTMLATTAVGFGPTFYLRSVFGTVDPVSRSASLPSHLVLHGVFLTAWFSLLVLQVFLVRARRVRLHRQLGVMGLAIAVGVVFSTVLTMHRGTPRRLEALAASGAPLEPAAQAALMKRGSEILIHDFWMLVAFVLLVGTAVYLRAQANTHKRLIILASVSLIGPALSAVRPIGRVVAPYMPSGIRPSVVFLVLCILALVCHDAIASRRIERGTLWGGAVLVAAVTTSTIMLSGASGLALARTIWGL